MDDESADVADRPTPKRRRIAWTAVGVVVLAAAALGAVTVTDPPASSEVAAGEHGAAFEADPVPTDAPATTAPAPATEPAAPAIRWPALTDVALEASVLMRVLTNDEIFEPGARPTLDAERVICRPPEGFSLSPDEGAPQARGYEGGPRIGVALTDELVERDLVDACGVDSGGQTDIGEPVATCASHQGAVPEVFILWEGMCAELGDGSLPVTAADLAVINSAKAAEIRILAIEAPGDCPTFEDALAWAEEQVRSMALPLTVRAFGEGPGCYRPVTLWEQGEILVATLGMQP